MNKKNLKILIVDGFAPMRRIIQNDMQIEGYNHFFSVENGLEALQICEKEAIDLIISGWDLPVMSGLDLVKSIRSAEKTEQIPILLLTSETDITHINEAISAGINDLIVKPFTPDILYQKLDLIVSGKSPFIKRHITEKSSAETETNLSADDKLLPVMTEKVVYKGEAKLLIIDDLPSNIDIIVGILKDSYKIQAATSGKKGLKIAETLPLPDLILLDIMMPEMDGMEVCRQLKNNPRTMDIPVIFLTAKTDAETAIEGFSLGAVDYITKPVNPGLLKARVHNHIELKQSKDSLKNQVNTLMEMARLREDFERISQHDMKKPLGFIINKLSSLQNSQQIENQDKESIKEVKSSVVSLLNIMNNSLNLYKMETQQYSLVPEAVDIVKLTIRVKDDLSHIYSDEIKAKNVQIKLKIMTNQRAIIKGEELLCYSILSNLLKNAIEASEANEIIKISITAHEQVVISIQNQAEIPQQIRNCFFNKYSCQGKERQGKKQSTGLGTYSAKLMTEIQHGQIEFSSSSAEGTELTIKLPKWDTA